MKNGTRNGMHLTLTLVCDGCGAERTFSGGSTEIVMNEIDLSGWIDKPEYDCCPACLETMKSDIDFSDCDQNSWHRPTINHNR